jgi:DNA polymerase-3 subunit beta
MNTEISFQKLKDAVSLTERIANKHLTLPVLSCILLDIQKNEVTLKATNLDVGIEVNIPAKSSSEGVVAIPAHTLSAFFSQIPESENVIKLEIIDQNVHIQTSRSKGVLKTMPAEDFPSIPRPTGGDTISLARNSLIRGFKSVWYSSSLSNVKPELSSVYVYSDTQNITFVATDSFRLAEKKIPTSKKVLNNDILIPFKNVSELIRVMDFMPEDVEVEMGKNLISLKGNGIYVISRIIDGVFPDYKQIIPKSYVTEVVVLKQDLINALKISNVFSDKFNQIKFTIDPAHKVFEISTKNIDIGENKTKIDASITGEKLELNFNSKYIIDSFQSIDSDSISLQLSGMNRPMVIRPVSGEQTFMYLVMPMNR